MQFILIVIFLLSLQENACPVISSELFHADSSVDIQEQENNINFTYFISKWHILSGVLAVIKGCLSLKFCKT